MRWKKGQILALRVRFGWKSDVEEKKERESNSDGNDWLESLSWGFEGGSMRAAGCNVKEFGFTLVTQMPPCGVEPGICLSLQCIELVGSLDPNSVVPAENGTSLVSIDSQHITRNNMLVRVNARFSPF